MSVSGYGLRVVRWRGLIAGKGVAGNGLMGVA